MHQLNIIRPEYTTIESSELFERYCRETVGNFWPDLFNTAQELPGQGYIMEIGCGEGASLISLAGGSKIAGKGKVISIDIDIAGEGTYVFTRYHDRFHDGPMRWHTLCTNLRLTGVDDWVILIGANSLGVWKILDLKLELLFVDGNHCYENVKNDIINYGKFLVTGGIIFCHDYWDKNPETIKAIDECVINSGLYTDFKIALHDDRLIYARKI